MGEDLVALEAKTRGVEVLKNLSPHGKTDLCLIANETLIQVDVKVASWNQGDQLWVATSASNILPPVFPVIVKPVGASYREWQISWHKDTYGNYKCPLGLENFWD